MGENSKPSESSRKKGSGKKGKSALQQQQQKQEQAAAARREREFGQAQERRRVADEKARVFREKAAEKRAKDACLEDAQTHIPDAMGRPKPVPDLDPLWLLRRTRSTKDDDEDLDAPRGPIMVRSTMNFDDRDGPPTSGSDATGDDDRKDFALIAKAPMAAALLTVGYDSPKAEPRSVRLDLDLRKFRLDLDSETLREKQLRPDDVTVGVFALFGNTPLGGPVHRHVKTKANVLVTAAAAVTNRILRPALALFILAWGARLL